MSTRTTTHYVAECDAGAVGETCGFYRDGFSPSIRSAAARHHARTGHPVRVEVSHSLLYGSYAIEVERTQPETEG